MASLAPQSGANQHAEPTTQERASPSEVCRALAEFIGTFFLVFVAAGADVIASASGGEIAHTSRYLAPGFLIVAMIWSLSGISGAHLNPAVTLAFVLRRSFPPARAVMYWVVQLAGAIAAATVLRLFFGELISKGASKPGPDVSAWAAVSWEALLTTLLILVILGTAENEAVVGKNAALAVGFTVALCGLFSSPITGASMNPARSLGPQIVAGMINVSWIYVAGPAAGACIAAILAFLLFGSPKSSEHEAARGKHV